MKIDCELFGSAPSDQPDGSSQLPLGLIQLLAVPLWPKAVARKRNNVKKTQLESAGWALLRCIVRLIPHVKVPHTNGVKTGGAKCELPDAECGPQLIREQASPTSN